ncbi:hypothetical protein [Shinella kummerowiae]|uniref:hypothetical protein n=1 Tax=Shinella kummerowiae TaxID=417745 RepID=UPI0021B554CA|nr:hypothetical protein [Shinella kummerowiae]MCT7667172.1 hypothetical protein [Shinella kummerowiae]
MKLNESMRKEVETALKLCALFFGVVAGFVLSMVLLLFASLWVDVGLATAFMLQLLIGGAGGFLALWRTS